MESPSFAPGRPRQESKAEKRERLRRKQLEKRRKQCPHVIPKRPTWLLLPSSITKGFEFWIHTMKGDSFLEKKAALQQDIKRWKEPVQSIVGFDTSRMIEFHKDYVEKANVVMGLLYQNQSLRWKFKRFFTQLRIQRFPRCNDVDPITLEPIQEPIQVPLFAQRKLYVFEANPFMKHLHTKLVQSDAQIPDPQPMKNPLTNEAFTTAQLISLIAQAKRYGHTSWAIESFCSSRYDLASYILIYSKPLRLHAIRTTMANVYSWDSIDTLYDFIKSQHILHEEVFRQDIYAWAVHHAPHQPRIVSWRKMCLKWYEVDILIEDPDSKESMFRVIESKTLPLCTKPKDLQEFRRSKRKSAASSDGSRSS